MTRNNPETCITTGSGIASTPIVLLVTLLEEASRPPSRVFSIRVFLLFKTIPKNLSKYSNQYYLDRQELSVILEIS